MKSIFLIIYTFVISQISFADEWNRIYLATYPRSGNHWMRYLLEEATGTATSSVYIDQEPKHLKEPFPWGGYCPFQGYNGERRYPNPQDFVVIKTHFPCLFASVFDLQPYKKVIRVIRHPIDCIYSYYVYKHRTLAANNPIMPNEILMHFIASWRSFHEYWNAQPEVVTIRYEDLFIAPYRSMQKVVSYTGMPISKEDIVRALQKYPATGVMLRHFEKYTPEQIQIIETQLKDLMKKYNYPVPIKPKKKGS